MKKLKLYKKLAKIQRELDSREEQYYRLEGKVFNLASHFKLYFTDNAVVPLAGNEED